MLAYSEPYYSSLYIMHTIKIRAYFSIIILTILVVYILSISTSFSYSYCKCSREEIPAEQKFRSAYAVFTGEVTKIRRMIKSDDKLIHFSVIDSWKGAKREKFIIKTGVNDILSIMRKRITCDVPFEVGEKYLVFSYMKNSRSKFSYTSNCGNVIPFKNVEKAEKYIEDFGKPKWHFPIINAKNINVNEKENMDPMFQKSLEGFYPKEK